jgi:hypothetical protein
VIAFSGANAWVTESKEAYGIYLKKIEKLSIARLFTVAQILKLTAAVLTQMSVAVIEANSAIFDEASAQRISEAFVIVNTFQISAVEVASYQGLLNAVFDITRILISKI